MIRTKTRKIAEPNSKNTVTTTATLSTDKLVVGNGDKSVGLFDYSENVTSLLYTDANGKIQKLEIPKGSSSANKYIGTDSSGNLVLKTGG